MPGAVRSPKPSPALAPQPGQSKPTSPNFGPFRKAAAAARALADESFQIRRQAIFDNAMARFGKK